MSAFEGSMARAFFKASDNSGCSLHLHLRLVSLTHLGLLYFLIVVIMLRRGVFVCDVDNRKIVDVCGCLTKSMIMMTL